MWLFTRTGFVSIVEHRDDPDTLVVRSRFAGHIRRIFPDAKVFKTPEADYLYRAYVPRRTVAEALYKAVEAIDYPNFKNAVGERAYHDACSDVWATLYHHQGKA